MAQWDPTMFAVSINDDLLDGTEFECKNVDCKNVTPCSLPCLNNFLFCIQNECIQIREELFACINQRDALDQTKDECKKAKDYTNILAVQCKLLLNLSKLCNLRHSIYTWAATMPTLCDADKDFCSNAAESDNKYYLVICDLYLQQWEQYLSSYKYCLNLANC